MRLLITGGTGFIGSALVKQLKSKYKISVLTRNALNAHNKLGHDIECLTDLSQLQSLDKFDLVINLAGEPIADKRWSDKQKQAICDSRWKITQQLVELLDSSTQPPKCFISGSAIGFYGRQANDIEVNEEHQQINDEFTHQVCQRWEQLAAQAQASTRVCILRTGVVLGKQGALAKMLPAFQFGLGGPISHGQQMMSWIHIDDMVDAIIHLIDNEDCDGVYNCTAPNPVNNLTFSQTLSQVLNRPCFFTVPAPVLKLALGEMSDLLLTGQAVVPNRLIDSKFHFHYPELAGAFRQILKKPETSD